MRKYVVLITAILSIILMIILLCVYYGNKLPSEPTVQTVSTDEILANSKWIDITTEDIDLLNNENYSENIQQIISSLENGIPVILKVEGGSFDKSGNGSYITLSAFDTTGDVITYKKTASGFKKASVNFYLALEGASSALIITNEESLS